MSQNPAKTPDCKVCVVEHDEDIHNATLRVRDWFAAQVKRNFVDYNAEEAVEADATGTAA